MKKFLQEEIIKFIFGLFSTAIGVLIALLINSHVETQKDKDTYKSMLKAISNEALANKTILEESFETQYVSGIIRREFSVKICEEFLESRIFLNHVPDRIDSVLIEYTLNLKRANSFRIADEKYKYDPVLYKKWGDNLCKAFEPVLKNCKILIDQIINLN